MVHLSGMVHLSENHKCKPHSSPVISALQKLNFDWNWMKLNDREQNEPNRHYMGHLKQKSAFKHAQNVQIQIFFFFFFFLCWGFTAQSTQWGHVERGQFT